MAKTTLLEDKRLIRLVCTSLLGMQGVVVVLMLSLAYPFVRTMNEMSRQFPQIMESIRRDKDDNLVSLEKEIQAIKSSLEEVKGSMKKMEVIPITMTNMNEQFINADQDLTWITDNMMDMRRKTEKYLATVPLMENSITRLSKELSTINFEMKKIQAKLPNIHESSNCLSMTFEGNNPLFKGYSYRGETFLLPSKEPLK